MAEKRELILDLLSRNKMGAGTAAAARDIDKVGTAADAASKKTDRLGKASVIAGKGADDLGDSSSMAARQVEKLDREIGKVNQDLVLLHSALADADDAAGRLDISKGIRKSQADLKRLTSSKGVLENLLPDPGPAAAGFMKKLGGALGSAGAGIATGAGSKVGVVIGGALAAAAAPVLISGIGAALSSGAGLTGIGAGVALAVGKDKDIQAAGQYAGKRFADGLTKTATSAYKQPIMTAIGVLSQAGDRVSKQWQEVFRSTSGMLVPFVQDIVRVGERISDSLAGAAIKSAPAVAALGDALVLLGDGAGDALDILADGSLNAAGNLRLLAGVTADVLRQSATFLGALNDLSANPWVTGPLLPLLKKKYADTAAESDSLSDKTETLASGFTTAAQAARGQVDALEALATEMKAQTDPAFALLDAQDKVRESQKNLNKEIKEHGRDSKQARAASRDLAKAAIDLQGKAGALGDEFDGNLSPAMLATMRAAGMTERQIDGVRDEMNRARKAGGAYAKNYQASVSVKGAPAARRSLYSVKDIIDDIPRAVHIAMKITGVGNVSAAAAAVRKNARASGGPVARGIPYLVGEHGPEMIVPEAAGRVLSAAATRGTMSNRQGQTPMASTGGMGMGPAAVRLELVGPEEMRVWFRKMVRTMNIIPGAA
jgi:hypothetical protein